MKFDILGDFSNISTSQKLEMNTFSISTILRRLLGEFEPSSVFYCYCKELSSWSWAYGPKIGQNCIKYDVLGTFRWFHFKTDRNGSIFWNYNFIGVFLDNLSPLTYFFGSISGFLVGHMAPNMVPKLHEIYFWALFEHFHFMKYVFW